MTEEGSDIYIHTHTHTHIHTYIEVRDREGGKNTFGLHKDLC